GRGITRLLPHGQLRRVARGSCVSWAARGASPPRRSRKERPVAGPVARITVRKAWIPVVAVRRSAIRSGLPRAWGGRHGPPVPAPPTGRANARANAARPSRNDLVVQPHEYSG